MAPRGSTRTNGDGTAPADLAVVLERIEQLRTGQDSLICDVKGLVTSQAQSAVIHTQLDHKASTALKASEDHEQRILNLEKAIGPLIWTNRILASLAGALTLSIIALIWSLIIGQAQLVFP